MTRIAFVLVGILTAATVCSAQSTLYYPHIVNGALGGHVYKTTIFLTNPAENGTGILTGSITFRKESKPIGLEGTALNIVFTDVSGQILTGNSITFQLTGGQSLKLISNGIGELQQGFATVLSTAPVAGTAEFSDFDSTGRLTAEASVPAVTAVPRQTIFVDTVGGYNVGVAYANPGVAAASVTLTLLTTAGIPVASTVQTLGAGNHIAAFASQLFPNVTIPPMAGTLQVISTTPLAALALRYDPSFTVFSTLSAVTIGSPPGTVPNGQLHGEVTDPLRDAISDPRVPISPDLVLATGDVLAGNVTFRIRLAPGTFDPLTTRFAVDLDTDQDRSTGAAGVDYYVFIFPSGSRGADVARATSTGSTVLGTVPVNYVADGADVTVPLSLLGNDDGRLDFRVRVYSEPALPVILDVIPDGGFGRIQ